MTSKDHDSDIAARSEQDPAGAPTEAIPGRSQHVQPPTDGPPRLLCVEGPMAGAKHDLKAELTIGRSLGAGLVIQTHGVSRLHARIEPVREGGWAVQDLQSKNGTLVNETRVERHVLTFGDRIRVGDSVFLFSHANPWEAELDRRQRLEALGRLGASVAHDFNDMLQSLGMTVEYLRTTLDTRGVRDANLDSCFRDIHAVIDRGTDLSRRLLGAARGDGHAFARVHLSELCREVLDLTRRTIPSTIECVSSIPARLYVVGDREQLREMLLNLCVHSCDAMPRGGRLTLNAERVRGSASAGALEDRLRITISDTGVGMDVDARRKVFDPIFTTKAAGDGTSLGLAIVTEAVKCHGGHLELDSAPNRGTTWRITLPEASIGRVTTDPDLPRSSAMKLQALRILVADDDTMLVRSLSRVLIARGHRVSTASDGRQALEVYAAEQPELVLMDLQMPRMDGREALMALRQRNPTLKVLMMSGDWHERYPRELGLEPGGSTGFLLKPWSATTLEAAVKALLAGSPPLGPREDAPPNASTFTE